MSTWCRKIDNVAIGWVDKSFPNSATRLITWKFEGSLVLDQVVPLSELRRIELLFASQLLVYVPT